MDKKNTLVVLNLLTKEVDLFTIPNEMASDYDTYIQSFGYKSGTYSYMVADGKSVKVNHKSNYTYGYLGSMSVNGQCGMVKAVEQEQLIEKLRGRGLMSYSFKDKDDVEPPVVACYLGEHPCDFKVTSVEIDDNNVITLYGYDVEAYSIDEIDLDPFDVFEGHLEYVTLAIK